MGRFKSKNPKIHVVQIGLTRDIFNAFVKQADDLKLTKAELGRSVIKEYLKKGKVLTFN